MSNDVHVSTVRYYVEQIMERPISDRTWARWCKIVLARGQRVCTQKDAKLLCTIASLKRANPKRQIRGGRREVEALLKAQIVARKPAKPSPKNVRTWDDLAKFLGVHRATCFRWRSRYGLEFPERDEDCARWEGLMARKVG